MIHILLLILKIIGLILLAVLGIFLLLVLLVLFVPIRYKVEGSWHGEIKALAGVYWLFRLLSLKAAYSQDGFTWTLRILGFKLGKKKKEDVARSVEDGVETVLNEAEQEPYRELEQDESAFREKKEDKKAEQQKERGQDAEDGVTQDNPDTQQSWFERMGERFRNQADKLKRSAQRLSENAEGAVAFIRNKKEWLEDGKNQASIQLLWKQLKRLLNHVWPGKGNCSVTFGFEDPYSTGQVLQSASLIYPFYHRQVSLYPVFDEKVLDVEGRLNGRVRLAFVLWLAFQVYWDKHTRSMLRGFIK